MGIKSILGEEECHDDLISSSSYKCISLTGELYQMRVQDFMRHIKWNELTSEIFWEQVNQRWCTLDNFFNSALRAESNVRWKLDLNDEDDYMFKTTCPKPFNSIASPRF